MKVPLGQHRAEKRCGRLRKSTGRNSGLCTLRRVRTISCTNHIVQRAQKNTLTVGYSSSEKDNQPNESHFQNESHRFLHRCDCFSRLDYTSTYDRPTASQL